MIVANTRAIAPGAIMSCRIVGVLIMEDEAGGDEKLIAVPSESSPAATTTSRTTPTCPRSPCDQIEHFFAHYKDLEPGKWVKIVRWRDADHARQLVLEGIERAKTAKR